jgi:hypothetical protein
MRLQRLIELRPPARCFAGFFSLSLLVVILISQIFVTVATACAAGNNKADGSIWQAPRTLRAGKTAGPPAIADLNHDGRADIVFPCAAGDSDHAGQLAVFQTTTLLPCCWVSKT